MSEIDAIVADAKRAYELGDDELGDELLRIADSMESQESPAQTQPAQADDQGFLSAATETGATIGSGMVGSAAGGLAGLYELARTQDPEAATAALKAVQDSFQYTPEGQRSAEQLENIGGAVETVTDYANIPLSGLAGAGEVLTGQGMEQAAQTVSDVQDVGLGKTLGARTLEETGSPALATVAEMTPALAETALGFGGASAAKGATATGVKNAAQSAKQAAQTTAKSFKRQSKNKQQIAEILDQSPTDVRGFGYEILRPKKAETPEFAGTVSPDDIETFFDAKDQLKSVNEIGQARVKRSKRALDARKQGFEEQTVQFILGSSPADKAKYKKMIGMARELRRDKAKAKDIRLTNVVGESIGDRVRYIYKVNQEAGKKVGEQAKMLPDNIDFTPVRQSFYDDLADNLGVDIVDGNPRFLDSQVEDFANDQKAIMDMIKLVERRSADGSGVKLHELKKRIDRQVTFGKQSEGGLSPEVERVLKGLRVKINDTLGDVSPEYKKANEVFSETIGALDELQSIGGKRLDITGDSADEALGILSRRLASNAVSSVPIKDAVNAIEAVARKYGGEFDDSLFAQLTVAEDLNTIFRTSPQTSLKGEMTNVAETGAQLATSPERAAIGFIDKGIQKAKRINEENAFKSLEALLEE